MANMWLLFETKQQQQTVLWWLSHEFGVAMSPTTVLAASIQILCDNTCDQKQSQSLLKKQKQSKTKNGIIYMYTSYLARTQKIEEIVTLNTLMKPIQLRQAG